MRTPSGTPRKLCWAITVALIEVITEQESILPCKAVLFAGTCLLEGGGGQQTVALAFATAALVAQSFASANIVLIRPLSRFP
jgi:hypothetical protein